METTTSDAATKGEKLQFVISWWATGNTAECVFNALVFVSRLQRPNVYLPVHLYGQLVHDKTGCHLLEAQVTTSACFLCSASFILCVYCSEDQLLVQIQQLLFMSVLSVVSVSRVWFLTSATRFAPRCWTPGRASNSWRLPSGPWLVSLPLTLCPLRSSSLKEKVLTVLVLFFLPGQHWLFKLGSESPAGGERHSWHPGVGAALWGAVSTRVSSSSGSFSIFNRYLFF